MAENEELQAHSNAVKIRLEGTDEAPERIKAERR
jgi:hypothetical protein